MPNISTDFEFFSKKNSKLKCNDDIFILKIPLSNISTGFLSAEIPKEFELFNISYSAEHNSIQQYERAIFAIYTFIRIKNNLKKIGESI